MAGPSKSGRAADAAFWYPRVAPRCPGGNAGAGRQWEGCLIGVLLPAWPWAAILGLGKSGNGLLDGDSGESWSAAGAIRQYQFNNQPVWHFLGCERP